MNKNRLINAFGILSIILAIATITLAISKTQTPSKSNIRADANQITQSYGIGIIGDSNSDEYRADDNRGGSYTSTTLNWAEQLAQSRGLNFGTWSITTRNEPRRKGFEYNWARSAATSGTLLSQNQHIGLGNQIQQGKIQLIIVHIGANDFAPYNPNGYGVIYNGTLTDIQLNTKIDQIITNIDTALSYVNGVSGGNAPIIITNIFDWNLHPYIQSTYPDANKRKRVTSAINRTNSKMSELANKYSIAYNNLNSYAKSVVNSLDSQGRLKILNEYINVMSIGDEPHNGFLSDYIHAGSVMEGLFANRYIKVFNKFYGEKTGVTIEPLTNKEILQNSGILPHTKPCLTIVSFPERLNCLAQLTN